LEIFDIRCRQIWSLKVRDVYRDGENEYAHSMRNIDSSDARLQSNEPGGNK